MAEHKKFRYQSLQEVRADIKKLGIDLPMSDDIKILKKSIRLDGHILPNPLVIQPMEGCDGLRSGSPGELTRRRYDRFARGGAGLLWVEATAVVYESRANPFQLFLSPETQGDFKSMFDDMLNAAHDQFGSSHNPYTVLQLTHSGRYSRPDSAPAPIIAARNPYLDRNIPDDYPIITDDELEILEDKFVDAARMAWEIGYHAVDVKSCHRYLNNELLSAHTREGRYGGSFENRTRFLLNIVDKIKSELGDKIAVTLRMNAYDAIPYPYGWGVNKDDFNLPDLTEPKKLAKILIKKGIKLINISTGNPYYNPHVGRPYDVGSYLPPQHPLEGSAKMLNIVKEMQETVPEAAVIATGYTWLREYAANAAAAGIENGWYKLAGFGRQAFAYPDFPRDIFESDGMIRNKCCITCSKCTEIMRDGGTTGCVPRDSKVYNPIYKAGREGKSDLTGTKIAEHV